MAVNNLQLKALETLINQTLELDPSTRKQLNALAGKTVHINCTEPELHIVIAIHHGNLSLHNHPDDTVSSRLSGDLPAFIELLGAKDKVATLINGNLRLEGDSQLLMDLQKTLQSLELDWEFQLAQLIGDLPAHWLGKLSRETFSWLRNTQPIFMRHLQEFILEEAKLAPSNNEIEQFIQVLQQTVEKTERIEALLTRAKQHPRFRENAP